MTREDAIYEIKQLAVLSNEKNIDRITEVLEMAIEALQNADRKTENYSEKPNNCEDKPQPCKWCKFFDGENCFSQEPCKVMLYFKDEPQTERSE